jgi:hypothetical protein
MAQGRNTIRVVMHVGHGSVNSRLINMAAVCQFAGRIANDKLGSVRHAARKRLWWRGAISRRDSGVGWMIRGSGREHPYNKRARYKRQAASPRTSGRVCGRADCVPGMDRWVGPVRLAEIEMRCQNHAQRKAKSVQPATLRAEQSECYAGRCGLSMSHRKARSSVPKHAGQLARGV